MRGLFSGGTMLWRMFIVFCFTGLPLGAALITFLGFSPELSMGIGLVLAVFLTPYLMIRLGGGR